MKRVFVLLFLLFTLNAFAEGLKCSANGIDVYYVNGVLTKKTKNETDAAAIGDLFNFKKEQLDLDIKTILEMERNGTLFK